MSGGGGGVDPAASASSTASATSTAATTQSVDDMDDESLIEAATGMTPDGIPAAPSPLLATLMRSRDQQTPVTPTLVTAIGGRLVSGLADLVAAARASSASTSVAFRGVHSGKASFSMVDTMELGGSPVSVKQFAYDKGTLQWRGEVGGGGSPDAMVDAPADAALAPVDAAILPSSTRDIVVKSQAKGGRKKAVPASGASPSRLSVSAAAPSSAIRPQSTQLQPAGYGSDMLQTAPLSFASSSLIQAAVDSPNDAIAADIAAASPTALSSPASVAAWLSLAAHARGRVPVHATQTWNASQIAAFKRQAVTITIYEWYPLEHNTAASKATGSGFVVDSQRGIISTNAHVAGAMVGGWEVLFFDGSTAPVSSLREGGEVWRGLRWSARHQSPPLLSLTQARSIWFSPQQDIAFLKVDPAAIPYPDAVAPLASWTTFAADHAVTDGDFAPVLAVGSPGAFPFA